MWSNDCWSLWSTKHMGDWLTACFFYYIHCAGQSALLCGSSNYECIPYLGCDATLVAVTDWLYSLWLTLSHKLWKPNLRIKYPLFLIRMILCIINLFTFPCYRCITVLWSAVSLNSKPLCNELIFYSSTELRREYNFPLPTILISCIKHFIRYSYIYVKSIHRWNCWGSSVRILMYYINYISDILYGSTVWQLLS
jgi:hypothetical protein